MLVSAITLGVLLGLVAGLAPGPLLALIISQTLRYGLREGFLTAVAPLVTDVPIVLLSWWLISRMSDLGWTLGVLSLAGGLYLIYLGAETFRSVDVQIGEVQNQPRSLAKGSLVNFLNPHPYLFWITVGVPFVVESSRVSSLVPVLFVFFFYIFLVGSKIGLAWAVSRFSGFLSSRVYLYTLRVLGLGLFVFAAFLLVEAARRLGS